MVDGEEKPKTASLFRSMTVESVNLERALELLSLPRTLGEKDGKHQRHRAQRPLWPVRAYWGEETLQLRGRERGEAADR